MRGASAHGDAEAPLKFGAQTHAPPFAPQGEGAVGCVRAKLGCCRTAREAAQETTTFLEWSLFCTAVHDIRNSCTRPCSGRRGKNLSECRRRGAGLPIERHMKIKIKTLWRKIHSISRSRIPLALSACLFLTAAYGNRAEQDTKAACSSSDEYILVPIEVMNWHKDLESVAEEFHTTVEQILRDSHIEGPLRRGQVLRIRMPYTPERHTEVRADIDYICPFTGRTALVSAILNGEEKLALELIERGANVSLTKEQPALCCAARYGMLEIVKKLLEKGADPNTSWYLPGFTALHEAAYMGQTEVIKLLLESGADKRIRTRDINVEAELDATPYDLAVMNGHTKAAELLK